MSDIAPSKPTLGVILVDHGSRRRESNDLLHKVADLFARRAGHPIVEPAHMELAEPTIAQAFDRCVAAGAAHVVVLPYFLGPGRHWDQDIPQLTAEAAAKHPRISYQVAPPIGLHEAMTTILNDRLEEALSDPPTDLHGESSPR